MRRSIKEKVEGDIKKLVPVCCSAGCTGVGRPSDRTRAAVRTADWLQAGEARFLQQACLWAATVCSQQLGEQQRVAWPRLGVWNMLTLEPSLIHKSSV